MKFYWILDEISLILNMKVMWFSLMKFDFLWWNFYQFQWNLIDFSVNSLIFQHGVQRIMSEISYRFCCNACVDAAAVLVAWIIPVLGYEVELDIWRI